MLCFEDALKERFLVCDGAMGTMLYSKGVYINRCFDEVNLSAPVLVQEIHEAYAKAGTDILTTNTFGANWWHLKNYGLEEKTKVINEAGVRLAKGVASNRLFVAGDIGPIPAPLDVAVSEEVIKKGYEIQIKALDEAGIDIFMLETFTNLNELLLTIELIKKLSKKPIIAQLSFDKGNRLASGEELASVIMPIEKSGIVAWGINCSQGPRHVLNLIDEIKGKGHLPLIAQPNAGLPQRLEGRYIYFCTPEYLASYARYYIKKGVRIVGGCCGTTPAHIRAVRSAVNSLSPGRIRIEIVEKKGEAPSIPLRGRSRLASKLAQGKFVTNVELTPPKGHNAHKTLEKAKIIKEMGIDAINIPDGPRATARMSAQALAVLIERDVGIETVLHVCCRDRNLIGLQADLLGGHALGIRNILIITGDPPKLGDYPHATGVFDLDSVGLVKLAHNLNRGQDLIGRPLGAATGFLIGVGVNPVAVDIEREISHFEDKVRAGAEFAITQPVFDTSALESFVKQIKHLKIPIIAGIWPLTSHKAALFMNTIPGVTVPKETMERMERTSSGDAAISEGVAIARETLESVKDLIQGAQISAPLGKVEIVAKVLGLK